MKRYFIAPVAFLMFFVVEVRAQFMPGNVVVHSDPRLAVLLKKNPTAAPPPTPVSYSDESGRRNRNTSKTTTNAKEKELARSAPPPALSKNSLPAAPTHQVPVSPAPEIASNIPAKPKGPPVHPFVQPATHKDSRIIYSGKGFRVQIYNGYDREKAIKVKTEFMRQYPGMRTYLTYASPHFRVKVGDYRNLSDAVGMLKEANAMYDTPCMIVPDEVAIHAY